MSAEAAESAARSVARFNRPGRAPPPKVGASGRGDASGAVKPAIAKRGYVRFLTLRDFDGRSRAAQRVKEIIGALEADLGGRDRLSEAQCQLVTRAAMLAVQAAD